MLWLPQAVKCKCSQECTADLKTLTLFTKLGVYVATQIWVVAAVWVTDDLVKAPG